MSRFTRGARSSSATCTRWTSGPHRAAPHRYRRTRCWAAMTLTHTSSASCGRTRRWSFTNWRNSTMPLVNATLEDRDVRQRDLVPPQRLAAYHALVVGVGAVGRQVALQLAALGIPGMDLIDHDIVNVENLAPQSYWPADLGRPKVDATAALCAQVNPDLRVAAHHDRFRRSTLG